MRTVAMLRLPDEAAWLAVRGRFQIETDSGGAYLPGVVCVVERGVEYQPTGRTIDADGFLVPEVEPVDGYHVHVLLMGRELPADLWQYLDNAPPRHVYAGHEVLSMPEATEDDGDVILVERAPGAAATVEQITQAEAEHVRRKLTSEEREERRALHAAVLRVIEARRARDAVNARLTALAAERTEKSDERDAVVAELTGKTGAARLPIVAARDALTERMRVLTEQIAAEQAVRTAAIDAVTAARADADKLRFG